MIEVVVALILTLNGSIIEHVYKDKMSNIKVTNHSIYYLKVKI